MTGLMLRNKVFKICMVVVLLAVAAPSIHARSIDIDVVYAHLKQEMTADLAVQSVDSQRMKLIHEFVKRLRSLDDLGLGSPALQAEGAERDEHALRLERLVVRIQSLLQDYHHVIKPVLLNNIKLKRSDDIAKQNQGELFILFRKTKYNHRTARPISGILHYKADISTSIFSEKLVDAGLLVNFPNLAQEPWVMDALAMEDELLVFFRMHRESLDGVIYEKTNEAVSLSQDVASTKPVSQILSKGIDRKSLVATEKALQKRAASTAKPLPAQERRRDVHRFVKALQSLGKVQDVALLKKEMALVVSMYQDMISPILLNNVKLKREDDAAKQNSGELLSLFFANRHNHHTGKPVSGILRYQHDISSFFAPPQWEDAGWLVVYPDLADDKVIQDALVMESELTVLAEQHRKYLNQGTSIF